MLVSEDHIREIAKDLAKLRDVKCEGVTFDVMDTGSGERLPDLLQALAEAGVELPVAMRVEAGFAFAAASKASRLVVLVGILAPNERLAEVAKVAVAAGVPVEWELRGRLTEISELVDRALAAARSAGLSDQLFSADAELAHVRAIE